MSRHYRLASSPIHTLTGTLPRMVRPRVTRLGRRPPRIVVREVTEMSIVTIDGERQTRVTQVATRRLLPRECSNPRRLVCISQRRRHRCTCCSRRAGPRVR
ncbi:uncharacterized protein SCHCODRAFT_02669613 [Schizophyllum commune H4-8]|uniref:Expressed protein n=1 Tax=Schizophyllum commune (strain H4-8 / FGSC 9210) TaxID=578458 RepID=D8Q9C6_SCHCM|nr:uncharacterized protein SCHCODRAFT_02669613 [Schizophyllum commune H4-8]KAI5890465.1 hypothetical protein SCHCODRAFT_02669613 [Schizophyllum commune H4-8]